MRLWVTIALACAALAAGAGAAGASARSTVGYFQTPSHNIVCVHLFGGSAGTAGVDCGIKSGLEPPPRRIKCTVGDPTSNFVDLGVAGRAAEPSCAGDPGPFVGEAHARVLAYGTTWRHGALRCSSAVTGLTCRNRSGHGFFLSRAHSRRF